MYYIVLLISFYDYSTSPLLIVAAHEYNLIGLVCAVDFHLLYNFLFHIE